MSLVPIRSTRFFQLSRLSRLSRLCTPRLGGTWVLGPSAWGARTTAYFDVVHIPQPIQGLGTSSRLLRLSFTLTNSTAFTMGMNLNLSASLNIFKLLSNPSLCLPHAAISTFRDMPIPLDSAFRQKGVEVNIKAVVLDKDDCFAVPGTNEVHKPYKVLPHQCSLDCNDLNSG